MLKMTDVLEQSFVQNFATSLFSNSDQLDQQFNQDLLNVADIDLENLISDFFLKENAVEVAQALDIPSKHIEAIQSGVNLKDPAYVSDTAKIIAYCLAVETETLNQVEVSDSLKDFHI